MSMARPFDPPAFAEIICRARDPPLLAPGGAAPDGGARAGGAPEGTGREPVGIGRPFGAAMPVGYCQEKLSRGSVPAWRESISFRTSGQTTGE